MNSDISDFQKKVYAYLIRVPSGRVVTYGQVARAVGAPGAARAVGRALRNNPDAPRIPCHRVIKSDLTIGGFRGETAGDEVEYKCRILESEGVEFDRKGRLIDSKRVLNSE